VKKVRDKTDVNLFEDDEPAGSELPEERVQKAAPEPETVEATDKPTATAKPEPVGTKDIWGRLEYKPPAEERTETAPEVEEDDEGRDLQDREEKSVEARKKRTMQILFGLLAVLILFGFYIKFKNKEPPKTQDMSIDQFTTGQIRDQNDLRTRMVRSKSDKMQLSEVAEAPKQPAPAGQQQQPQQDLVQRSKPGPRTPGQGQGSNRNKDRDIIAKYEQINPEAITGTAPPAQPGYSADPYERNRMNRNVSTPGGAAARSSQDRSNPGKNDALGLHDARIRARLVYTLLSTAPGEVIAEATEPLGQIPAGSKFYGSASYNNQRAFISFHSVLINGQKTTIQARAFQGNDPGLSAAVSDISSANLGSNVAAGLAKTAGQVASGLAGTFAGGTAGSAVQNVVDPQTRDYTTQKEASKETVEYRVEARTPFIIYFE